MRRLAVFLLAIVCVLGMTVSVSGANHASKVTVHASVGSDKSCQVTVNAVLHIEDHGQSLQYPIPMDATNVTLEGSKVRPGKSGQAQLVDLSDAVGSMTGDLAVTISYTLPSVVGTNEAGQPELQLPLLSGYAYPIYQLDFTVTLPGEITAKPAFSSGYHQADIEKDLNCTGKGNAVTGFSVAELKDHETLTMFLTVEERWFPDAPLIFFESDADDIAMVVCGILALLYWLIFLRFLPPRRRLTPTVPEGITAGHLGAVLTLGSANLSLMVFSWAQMGYLQIQSGSKRVLLYKKMDMGNERSAFEQQCFRALFKKRDTVDATGVHYAQLCRKIRQKRLSMPFLIRKNSGNSKLFRVLSALICLFGGVSFGVALTQEARVQGIWIFLTATTGLICGYLMQLPMGELFLRKTQKTAWGVVCGLIFLILGIAAGQFGIAVGCILSQLAAGVMAFYGGRRTESGSSDFAQILGLRLFLKTASREELRRIQKMDPEYFHSLIPSAMALGVSHSFGKRFGTDRVPPCPYLLCNTARLHTAKQWAGKMERTFSIMEQRSYKLPFERLQAILRAARK